MLIRPALRRDMEKLHTLSVQNHTFHAERFPVYFKRSEIVYTPSEWREFLNNPSFVVLVAEVSEHIVGFALMEMRVLMESLQMRAMTCAYVINLCVDANVRGQGIGTKLLQACEQEGMRQGADELSLMVWSFNEGAIRLYERLGMKEVYRQMRKQLRE